MKKKALLVLAALLLCALTVFAASCQKDDNEIFVAFNSQGGPLVETMTVEIGKEYELPGIVREGYRFDGWYASADYSGSSVTTAVAGETDVIYYAKWIQQYAVTLELAGGTLSTSKIYLDEGASVYDEVKDLKPQKAGFEFGAWFNGNAELAKNTKMTTEGVTLTAKYKVAYTVEFYTQKVEGNDYENVVKSLTMYNYEGTTVNIDTVVFPDALTPFNMISHADAVNEITLVGNPAENVLRCYFNRNVFNLSFNANYPDDSKSNISTVQVRYGDSYEVPSNYEFSGYVLSGWATSKDGEVVYKANYIENHIYNATETVPGDKVSPDRHLMLYAVWSKGYADLFNGEDALFLFDEDATEIYMLRSGVFFKGQYNKEKLSFIFDISQTEILEGRLLAEGIYAYLSTDRANYTGKLFRQGVGFIEGTTVYLDEYNGIVYSVKDATSEKPTDSHGTYTIDENGYYIATFPETYNNKVGDDRFEEQPNGVMAGKTVTLLFGRAGNENAFIVREEDEYELGLLFQGGLNKGVPSYATSANQLMIDGYGLAYFFGNGINQNPSASYFYSYSEVDGVKMITLTSTSGQNGGTYRIETFKTTNGEINVYMPYNESMDITITAANGDTFTMDGVYGATYTKADGTVLKGNYVSAGSTPRGYAVIDFYVDGTLTNKILVSAATEYVEDETGVTIPVTVYDFSVKLPTYAEYYYSDETGFFYAPLIVIDENEKGIASVYGYTKDQKFVLVASGAYIKGTDGRYTLSLASESMDDTVELRYTYLKIDTAKLPAPVAGVTYYTYSSNGYEQVDVSAWEPGVTYYMVMDYTAIKSVVFELDTESTKYAINYWHSYTNTDDVTTVYTEVYTPVSGDDKLTIIGMIAVYESKGLVIRGQYSTDANGLTKISGANGTAYVKLDTENKTFLAYQSAPYGAYVLKPDWTYSQYEYVEFDGLGGATYVIVTPATEEGAEDTVVKYVGTFTQTTDKTAVGAYIYTFTGKNEANETKEFTYIVRYNNTTSGTVTLICPYNDTYNGQYNAAAGGKLELDGYNYYAKYTDTNGTVYEGNYMISNENEVYLYHNEGYFYLDIKDGKTFTVRGAEFATYIYLDNQMGSGLFFTFDGYGNLVVQKIKTDENGNYVYDEQGVAVREDVGVGTYIIGDDGYYTVSYQSGNTPVTFVGKPDIMVSNNQAYNVFVKAHDEAVRTYVNEKDWSVLVLDNLGNATMFDKQGIKDNGTYTLITSAVGDGFGLFHYVNESNSDGYIYQYWNNGRVVRSEYKEIGYYTENLESLLFRTYGIATFNGSTNYYYFVEENGNVLIYHPDDTAQNRNEYGFVEESFGLLDNVKTYDANKDGTGETYYKNSRAQIIFKRGETLADGATYPFTLLYSANVNAYIDDLVFTPSGAATFRVNGILNISYIQDEKPVSKMLNCIVVREINDEGVAFTYFTIGSYRFDIAIDYNGDYEDNLKNHYTITSKKLVLDAKSEIFLQYNAIYQMFFGITMENTLGTVHIEVEYDGADQMVQQFIEVNFGKDTELYDYNGNKINPGKTDFSEEVINNVHCYISTFTGEDGYKYKIYFGLANSQYGGIGYTILAVTRVESLVTDNGYKVEVARVVASEAGLALGDIMHISLYQQSGEEWNALSYDVYFSQDNGYYYVVRETDGNGKITATTYYYIELKEKEVMIGGTEPDAGSGEGEDGGEGEGEGSAPDGGTEETVPKLELLESATVTATPVSTVYNKAGTIYYDIDPATSKFFLISTAQGKDLISISKYDEDTKTYTVKTLNNAKIYTITVGTDNDSITEVSRSLILTADGKSSICIEDNNKALLTVNINGEDAFVDSFTYDEETLTYTAKVGEKNYTIVIETLDGKRVAVITEATGA